MHEKKEVFARDSLVKWFSELSNKDVNIAGGKGASLAEMANNKFPIPPGFIITAQAYQYFIQYSGLGERIDNYLTNLDVNNTEELNRVSMKIREMIDNSSMPHELESEIIEAYSILDADKNKMNNAGSGALEILRTGH